jgi:uncharacterized SAM-binding protein YcdF (DUF218 family)
MFFELSKILWIFVNPGNLLLILIILGAVILWTRWQLFGKWLVGFTALAFLVVAVVPLGKWMLGVLENRFPPLAQLPESIDGIIVAGGVVNPITSDDRGQLSMNGAVERVYEFAVLSQRYPKAKLIFSGGSGSFIFQDMKEAKAVTPLLRQLGVDLGRVIFEDQSRNTFENAVLSYRMVKPKINENWLLITSAFHMPRSVGTFRKAGWNVIPYPVDYQTRKSRTLPLHFNFSGGVGSLSSSIHEFCGLLFYWIFGKTDELFPEPR